MDALVGGVEAGGTKFVCAVGSGPDDIRAETKFPTTTPDETLGRVIDFFVDQERQRGALHALGVAAFGPLDPRPQSETYGYITSTPKPGWRNTDFVGALRAALPRPVAFDTDVNGAALGEWRWGAAQGLQTFIYLTIGTGVGGGGMAEGRLLHGLIHPEMGHMRLPHDWESDPFPGRCPYHGDCLEGMAAGPAMDARWGQSAESLPAEHPGWELEAHYLGLALNNLICTLSPERIVLGGGVMSQPVLLPMVRRKVQELLNGYVEHPAIVSEIDHYIVAPALGGRAGVLGAFALAQSALQ
jgi:fructokinase